MVIYSSFYINREIMGNSTGKLWQEVGDAGYRWNGDIMAKTSGGRG